MNSIRTRLLVVMLLLITVSLGILGGINYWKSKEILMREVQVTMGEKAGDSSMSIAAWFAERQAEIKVIARSPVILSGNEEVDHIALRGQIKRVISPDFIHYRRNAA